MEQGRRQEVGIVVAARQQPLRHVEPVATIGDRHPLEEPHGGRGKDSRRSAASSGRTLAVR